MDLKPGSVIDGTQIGHIERLKLEQLALQVNPPIIPTELANRQITDVIHTLETALRLSKAKKQDLVKTLESAIGLLEMRL